MRIAVVGASGYVGGRLVPRLVDGMELDRARMRAAIDASSYATDRAVELTAKGVPFRDAYREVAASLDTLVGDPDASLAARVSPGAPGDLRLDALRQHLDSLSARFGIAIGTEIDATA